jgi:peptidoglycan LD-endopeptidase LytH
MSSSNERKPNAFSTCNILVMLLISFLSGGAQLGSPGNEIRRQAPVKITPAQALHQKPWTKVQIDQLKSQSQQQWQLASLSNVPGNHGADPIVPESSDMLAGAVSELQQRHLLLLFSDLKKENLRDSFNESRGNWVHEAIDTLALRNTPILAVEDGSIARLWRSVPGGITIYQFDPHREFEYYYAHLESYANGLKEGDPVVRGRVIGYVGTSGNAPKGTPHLHFTIFKLTDSKHWWEGTSLNPYLVFR